VIERPEIHDAALHLRPGKIRKRVDQGRGRLPKGCEGPQWLGSAVPARTPTAALADVSLVLARTMGDGTHSYMVLARKRR
jgi:hypothetical protein